MLGKVVGGGGVGAARIFREAFGGQALELLQALPTGETYAEEVLNLVGACPGVLKAGALELIRQVVRQAGGNGSRVCHTVYDSATHGISE